MAINKIVAPLATAPNVFAAPVINHLNAHAINVNPIIKIANGYVKKGAMFCIGGELFAADADTAILGSNDGAIAVRLDVSGTTATAKYVDDDTGVTWNGAYHGWYDTTNRYYEMLWRIDVSYKTRRRLVEIPNGTIVQPYETAWWFVTGDYFSDICGMVRARALVDARPNIIEDTNYRITIYLRGELVYKKETGQEVFGSLEYFIDYGDFISIKIENLSPTQTLFVRYFDIQSTDPNLLRL